ncbi:MAG: Hint domain-containing protein [Alphaproteobacteria bacterium]|nr:Hint domain-containing protein [Alphaproteobacteria bacterium]
MASTPIIIKLVSAVGDTLTITGATLADLAAAFQSTTDAQKWNLVVQTAASISSVASDVYPLAIVPAVIASEIGVATGLKVLTDDQNQASADDAMGALTLHDILLVESDLVTVIGDLVSGIAGLLNTTPVTKPVGILASVVGTYLNVKSIEFLIDDPAALGGLKTAIENRIGELQSALAGSASAIALAFGNAGTSVKSAFSSALTSVSDALTSDDAHFVATSAVAGSALGTANATLLNLFDLTGATAPSMTETATKTGITTATADGSVSIENSVNFDSGNGYAYAAFNVSSGATTATSSGTNICLPDGTASLSLTTQSGSSSVSQDLRTDSSGTISRQQTILDGITIVSPLSQLVGVSVAPDNSLQLNVPSSTPGHQVTVHAASDGTDQVIFGTDSGNPQQVVNFAKDGLVGSQIEIAEASGSMQIVTDIAGGAVCIVQADSSVSGVAQDFRFGAPVGVLRLDSPSSFPGTITNFLQGDTIDLVGIGLATGASLGSGNLLNVQGSTGAVTLQLDPLQSFAGLMFNTDPDDSGGTSITVSPVVNTSGTQTIAVQGTIDDPNSGNPYSANVSFTNTNIEFPTRRTNDPLPKPVQISGTFKGGNLDPNSSADVVINQLYPNPSPFYLQAGFNIGPLNMSGTGEIASQAFAAGDYTDQILPLDIGYEGGSTELDITVSTKVYAPAVPEFESAGAQTFALDFGTIHLGETASRSVDIANVATGNLVDDLSSSPGTLGQFTAENGFSHIPAGDSATVVVDMTGELPGSALALGGAPLFGLTGHDSDLPDESVGQQSFLVLRGNVNYYANPIFSNGTVGSPVGTLTQNGSGWTLDLGTVALGSYGSDANVEIVNATPSASYSDTLTGTAELSTPPDGGFIQAINGLAGQMAFGNGGFLALGVFQPYGDVLGKHSETITFHPVSSNGSGFSGALPDETITIIDEVVQAPCYAAGTHISTPGGDVLVEDLAVGDTVCAQFTGRAAIRWIGHRHVHCSRHPEPRKVWPVRVRAGAFNDGVPYRDLWLSPDHAVFIDGVLIPIRLLINGTTVVQQAVDQITYFHVELSRHDVLLAEGLPAESYLDTGNRSMFADAGLAMMLHPDFATVNAGLKCWEHDACAPLATSAAQVEPIWEKLAGRALILGRPAFKPSITTDPRLRLEVCGHQLRPLAGQDGWHIFVLPPGPNAVWLVSNAGAPSDVCPWLEDRRRLGVSVRRIRARVGTELVDIPVDDPALKTGWHSVERQCGQLWRWTDGNACLRVPTGTRTLEVQLMGSAEYRAEGSSDQFIGPPIRVLLDRLLVTPEFHLRTA